MAKSVWSFRPRELSGLGFAGVAACLMIAVACQPTVKIVPEKPIEISISVDLTVHVPELRKGYKRPVMPTEMNTRQRDVAIIRALQDVLIETSGSHALVFQRATQTTRVSHEVVAPHARRVMSQLQNIPPERQHNEALDVLSRGECVVARLKEIADRKGRHSAVVDIMREEGMNVGAACPFFHADGKHLGEVLLTWSSLSVGREKLVIRELAHTTRDIETYAR